MEEIDRVFSFLDDDEVPEPARKYVPLAAPTASQNLSYSEFAAKHFSASASYSCEALKQPLFVQNISDSDAQLVSV